MVYLIYVLYDTEEVCSVDQWYSVNVRPCIFSLGPPSNCGRGEFLQVPIHSTEAMNFLLQRMFMIIIEESDTSALLGVFYSNSVHWSVCIPVWDVAQSVFPHSFNFWVVHTYSEDDVLQLPFVHLQVATVTR